MAGLGTSIPGNMSSSIPSNNPISTPQSLGTGMALTPNNPSGRRDKRRQTIAGRVAHISKSFEKDRDNQYREMLHTLQSTLSSLHTGKNGEFQEQLTDIEELRDQELLRLNLWEAYQIERTEQEYQREIAAANDEYNRMTQLVKERLMARLEAQRKKLREEKAYLDIANENNMFLSGGLGPGGYPSHPAQPYSSFPQNTVYLSGYTSGGNATATAGYVSNGGDVSGGNNSPSLGSLYGFPGERRSLRRRELMNASAFEEMSGLSAGGTGGGIGGGGGNAMVSGTGSALSGGERGYGSNGGSKRRKGVARNVSGDEFGLSDRDTLEGILFSRERDLGSAGSNGSGGHGRSSKSYQPPASLKNEDAIEDLAELKAAGAAIKRKRAE